MCQVSLWRQHAQKIGTMNRSDAFRI